MMMPSHRHSDRVRSRLPFRRRRSQTPLERLREAALTRAHDAAAVTRHAVAEHELPVELPNLGAVLASARLLRHAEEEREESQPAPAHRFPVLAGGGAGRPPTTTDGGRAARRRPADRERGCAETGTTGRGIAAAPRWMVITAVGGGIALGIGLGMWLTGRRAATRRRIDEMEAATDEIKAAWPDVTDADIQQARGSAARLAETIRSRTGEDAGLVRERITGMTAREPSANGRGAG